MSWKDRAKEVTDSAPVLSDWMSRAKPVDEPSNAPPVTSTSDPSLWQQAKSAGGVGLDYGLRGLDYLGGLTRTGVAEGVDDSRRLLNLVNGGDTKPAVTGDDWMSALKGKAPNTATYMDKLGVPEGGHLNLMPEIHVPATPITPDFTVGKGDSSYRDIGGFVGDVALDPLTYASLGSSAALKKGANVAGHAIEGLGARTYASGLSAIDKVLAEKGDKELSKVLLENGRPAGTMKQIQEKVYGDGGLSQQFGNKRAGMYDQIADAGITADPHYALNGAREKIAEMSARNPALRQTTVPAMEDMVNSYAKEGPVPIQTMSDWKSSLYEGLPSSAFDPYGKVKSSAKNVQQSMANGFKTEIENAGNAYKPGLGNEIGAVNEDWGSLLGGEKAMAKDIKTTAGKSPVSAIDYMLAGLSAAQPHVGLPVLAVKKAGQGLNTTFAKTYGGNALSAIGRTGAVDPIVRRSLIDANSSPYDQLAK